MLIRKKIEKLIVLGALSLVHIAYSAVYAPHTCQVGYLYVPCLENIWEFSGDALYYGSAATNAISYNVHGPNAITLSKEYSDFGWGYRLGAGLYFNKANAILLEWYHYRKTTESINDLSERHFSLSEEIAATSKFDIVNLMLEQKLNVGEFLSLWVEGGLQYAKLYTDGNFRKTPFRGWKYNTVGPRIAIDASYFIKSGFDIFGKIGVGMMYYHYVYSQTALSPTSTSTQIEKSDNTFTEYDTSVGVKYADTLYHGVLSSTVSWDIIAYDQTFLRWTGLRVGLKYIA